MNFFAITSLAVTICCLVLAVFIFIFSKTKVHKLWAIFNFFCFTWAIGTYFASISHSVTYANFAWRWAYGLGSFVPFMFYWFVYVFCGLEKKNLLRIISIFSFIFAPLNLFSPTFVHEFEYLFDSFYYNKATLHYTIFIGYLSIVVGLSFKELISYHRKCTGNKKNQTLYLLSGFAIGWSGGFATFLPVYNVLIYPSWNFVVCIYALLMTYAIFKYQLIELKIALTRISVFLLVYTLILGIPIGLGFHLLGVGLWLIPLLLMCIFATLGPFLYLFFQKKAEDKLLQEQRAYQSTLRRASLGMGQIKDLKRLLNLIVHIVTRAVRIEHCQIFLLHESSRKFVLKAAKGLESNSENVSVLANDCDLIEHMKKKKEPLIYDEIKQRTQDYNDDKLRILEQTLSSLRAELAVPSFIENKLIAMIILGKKKSRKPYSQDDLVVFSILASQSALAIENAIFYEETKRTHEQLFKAEKMATIGTMADGLSHQINNRLHAMGFIAGDAMDTIKLAGSKNLSPEVQLVLGDISHALERIMDNVKRGGEIVQGLLTYTRKGSQGFSDIDLNKLLDSSLEMAQFKIRLTEFSFRRHFDNRIPKIYGNFTQLQEVLFNVIDNSYDAIMQRKEDLKESDYKGLIEVFANPNGKNIEVIIKDNGIGVKSENHDKLFTPFFTTKLSSQKGTGLGMYVIRQIIEGNHNGRVEFTSEYLHGAQTKLILSLHKEEKI